MRKGLFQLDAFEGKEFKGYTRGDTWNGFACPTFTKEEALKVVEEFKEDGNHAFYDEENDSFKFQFAQDDCDEYDGYDITVDEENIHVYAIGAYAWNWSECKKVNK